MLPQVGPLARQAARAYASKMARADCPYCGGTGWKIVEGDRVILLSEQRAAEPVAKQANADQVQAFVVDNFSTLRADQGPARVAVPCDCTVGDRRSRLLERARLPKRYQHCNFESYDTDQYDKEAYGPQAPAWNRSLEQAKLIVQGFARDFPVGAEHGLLLMGPCGVGKTHLAVAALTEIVLRGHSGLFYDYRELLKQIQDSYNAESIATELGVLDPVLKAEVLLLDDLGSSKPSAWALETVGHILNTRYNEHRVTLLTTNFLDREFKGAAKEATLPSGQRIAGAEDEPLETRIGARIRSRLYEMCQTVYINSPDYRKDIRNARHSHA
jgi:DNA replication protein DnaC